MANQETINLLARAAAALETPDDLSADEKTELASDLRAAEEEMRDELGGNKLHLRAIVDIKYNLDGTEVGTLREYLERAITNMFGEGYITRDTPATVDTWEIVTQIVITE